MKSALKGKRGQTFLLELRDAMDAMPDKRLVTDTLEADGQFCTLGILSAKRGIDMSSIDSHCPETVSEAFGIARAMASEIVFENDEHPGTYEPQEDGRCKWIPETSERRWQRMRNWVESNIKEIAS